MTEQCIKNSVFQTHEREKRSIWWSLRRFNVFQLFRIPFYSETKSSADRAIISNQNLAKCTQGIKSGIWKNKSRLSSWIHWIKKSDKL